MPKFLVIRFSSIGDIVLTTPVIRTLKKQVPGAEIHFLTKTTFEPVLRLNPYVDKLILIDRDISEVITSLISEKYDAVIDLHRNQRSFLVKRRLALKSFSVNKLNLRKWLLVNFKINTLPEMHIVDRYMETVKSFGVVNDGLGLDYFISDEDEKITASLPDTHQNGYVAFVIGARHATKQLPEEKIISICKKLNEPLVLLGGKEDRAKGDRIVNTAGGIIYNACGICTINESAALVKAARKIITHDTGLMHIAAAFEKEIISVWGNTIPEFGMYPYYGNKKDGRGTIVEVKNLPCRPCSKIGFEKCPMGHFKCMLKINEDLIIENASSK